MDFQGTLPFLLTAAVVFLCSFTTGLNEPTINYEKLEVTKIIKQGQKTVPFVLKTRFKLDLKILKFSIPVETKGELPLPEISAKTLRKKRESIALFSEEMRL